MFAVFLALFPQEEKRRERESLPIYCWKSERPVTTTTLPALSGKEAASRATHTCDLKKSTHNTHREKKNGCTCPQEKKNGCTCPRLQQLNNYYFLKKEKKKRREEPGVELQPPASRSGENPLHYGEANRTLRNICLYSFSLVSLPHFLVRLLLCFSNNVVTFECCSLLCSSFLEGYSSFGCFQSL